STPGGISCPADCSESYALDTTVTLTAAAAGGSFFAGWSGAGCTGVGSCVVVMSADVSVTATFTLQQPDLVESSLSNPPATVRRKGSFSVSDTVSNQGTGLAASSSTRYYLSLDAVRGTGDILIGSRAVPGLASGAQSSATVTVKVPNSTPLGSYFVLACADDGSAVPESSETNNCRASATK